MHWGVRVPPQSPPIYIGGSMGFAEQARVVREQQCYRGLVGRSMDIRGLSHSEDS
jgi:hypothetical protein